MKNIIYSLLIFLSIYSCTNLQYSNSLQENQKINYVLEKPDSLNLDSEKFWDPDSIVLSTMEKIIENAIKESKENLQNLSPDTFKDYYRRYKCVYENGDRIIYVYATCGDLILNNNTKPEESILKELMEIEIITVEDGGDCFFWITINIDKKSYSDFKINGYA